MIKQETTAKKDSNIPQDLREFLKILEEKGCLVHIKGADWNLEIGALNEIMAERKGPALLFDKIKDYPEGYRITTNVLYRDTFQKIAFGMPEELGNIEAIRYWRIN